MADDQWEIEESSYEDVLKRFSGKTKDYDSDSDYHDEEDEDEELIPQTNNINEQNATNSSYENVLNPSRDISNVDTSVKRKAAVYKQIMKLTMEQRQEFKAGFTAVATLYADSPTAVTLPENLVSDVFLAAGFTFQDSDVRRIIEQCIPDANGEYSVETLLDAFDVWMSEQLKQEELGAVFNMLALDECILPEYPAKYERINPRIAPESRRDRKGGKKSSKASSSKRRVRKEAARTVLNEMLGRLGSVRGDSVAAEDIHAFLAEMATNHPDRGMHFDDFLYVFKG